MSNLQVALRQIKLLQHCPECADFQVTSVSRHRRPRPFSLTFV
jgi:hypothetical protein